MVQSEIGDFTWRSSPVVRELGKANSYWLTIVAGMVVPGVKNLLQDMHKKSRRKGGDVGVLLLYLGLLGFFFAVYHVIYVHGPQYLLPKAWR